MPDILPFKRTRQLVNEIDGFIDKVSEAMLVAQRTLVDYVENGPGEKLDERMEQIRAIEERGDELRRNIANVMYSQMLLPDTRGDVLNLLDCVDTTMDDCVHLIAKLATERPQLEGRQAEVMRTLMSEVSDAVDAMLQGVRAYFKAPHAVRDHVHKVNLHDKEATTIILQAGKALFASDLPLSQKLQLGNWLGAIRMVASNANDTGDQLMIFAVKRSI
jgi:predicted phosphate transport protein (TIGR00153 family)